MNVRMRLEYMYVEENRNYRILTNTRILIHFTEKRKLIVDHS